MDVVDSYEVVVNVREYVDGVGSEVVERSRIVWLSYRRETESSSISVFEMLMSCSSSKLMKSPSFSNTSSYSEPVALRTTVVFVSIAISWRLC